jgi:hypothetical protein
MATTGCGSPGAGSSGKARRHLVVPALALLFQLVPPLLLWAVSAAAYGEPRLLPEAWERPVSLITLGFSATVSLALGSVGAYGLLVRARPGTAALLIATCCVPALLGGAVYLHGLLVFLALV